MTVKKRDALSFSFGMIMGMIFGATTGSFGAILFAVAVAACLCAVIWLLAEFLD